MRLLADVLAHLARQHVPAALVGGVALAAHGIARATLDSDVLVVDARVLDEDFWTGWSGSAQLEVFRGDPDEALAGSIRVSREDEFVDVIVGRPGWQTAVLERCRTVEVRGVSLPIVDRADLILLKLLAGGPQDLLDVELLLASDPVALRNEVETRLGSVPTALVDSWRRLPSRR